MSAEFLSTLWLPEPLLGELRFIHDGEVKQQFHTDPERAYESALGWDGLGWDAYFGVLNRVRESGKAEDCVANTGVLWADLDTKNIGGSHMAALMALQGSINPSILVDSGHGLHCYWLLRAPIAFPLAEKAMRGLAKVVGGDHVYDAPRVLRIPGTHNHKYGESKPVRLLAFDPDRRYRYADFQEYAEGPIKVERPAPEPGDYQPYAELYDALKERIEQGAPQGERSEEMFSVCCSLIRRGWTDDQITDLFLNHPGGIGEKLTEMTERESDRYMRRTLQRAREVAE